MERKKPVYAESTPSTCCRARYLSLRSFCKNNDRMEQNYKINYSERILLHINGQKLTHSSITSPSPIIFGPASSGGFLRASSAASASANWRFNFSKAFKKQKNKSLKCEYHKSEDNSFFYGIIWNRLLNNTYWTRTLWIDKDNPQYLFYCHLVLLLIKLSQ